MIGYGIETVEFEEPALAAPVPACLDTIAAALWSGFRLVKPPQPNLENILVGKKRLPQFKDARRSELRRLFRVHFQSVRRNLNGDQSTVSQFVINWEADPALRRMIRAHVNFEKWRSGLAANIAKVPLVVMAEELSRTCYGRIDGNPETLSAFHSYMENGGI